MKTKSSQPQDPDGSIGAARQLTASFIPRLLRNAYASEPNRKPGAPIEADQGALLWIDVCEFSPMCTRLIEGSSTGIEKLSSILQLHYKYVLSLISEYGGEPVVYAGDGILALWPCKDEERKYAAELATTCGHKILSQRHVCNDKGAVLSLHAVVASGPHQLVELGLQNRWTYTVTGSVLTDLITTTNNRAPDQLLISPNVTALLAPSLTRKPVNFGAHILVDSPDSRPPSKPSPVTLSTNALNHLKAYVPGTISFPLNAERLNWIAELRPVTVVFVQLPTHGFDEATTIMRLRQTLTITMPLVTEMGGILNQVWVDEKASNLLVCFGPPPTSHPDNPKRGVITAIEIQKRLEQAGFKGNIGVTTGLAYCGILGDDTLRQYTVIGDIVNLASRLAGLKSGGIFVDQATHNNSQGDVEYDGPIMRLLKGYLNEVPAYIPIKVSEESLNRLASGVISTGREKELESLISQFESVIDSPSKLVVLEGETGMGKSTLLNDFNNQLAIKGRKVFSGKGDPIERVIPYKSWRDIFQSLTDPLDLAAEKRSDERIKFFEEKYKSNACLLSIVLQLEIPDSEEIKKLPVSKRSSATQDFLLQIIKDAATEPLAFTIDEARWMDDLSWNLLAALLADVKNCLFVLALQKADGMPQLQPLLNERGTLLKLGSLLDDSVEKIISEKFKGMKVSHEVLDLIKNIARGNPFFSKALVGSMYDQDLIQVVDGCCVLSKNIKSKNITLPETVRGAVRMQVDALSQGSQLAAKVGSVVGLRFQTDLICNIYPIENEQPMVPSYLYEVNQFGLIAPTSIDNMNGYIFNNETTADVVYEMTLTEQRNLLHKKSAEWFEGNFKENLIPFNMQLAYHWQRAGNNIKASEYLEREGARLIGMGYTQQALDLGIRGISFFGIDIDTDPQKVGPMIGASMSEISQLMQNRNLEDLMHLKKLENAEVERLIVMLTHVAPFAYIGGRLDLFAYMALVGLKLTLENGNGDNTGDVYSMYSIVYLGITGDSKTAFQWSQLALEIDKAHGRKLEARVAHVHCWFVSHWVRPIEETLPVSLSGAEAGVISGDVMFTCFNQAGYVAFIAFAGHPLHEVVETGRKNLALNNLRVIHAAFHIKLEVQIAKALQGLTIGNTILTDDEFEEENDVAFIINTDFTNQVAFYYVGKAKIQAHYGQWKEATRWIDKAEPIYYTCNGQIAQIEYHLFDAMASLYRSVEEEEGRQIFLERAVKSIAQIEQYASGCAANFEQKHQLLMAIKEGMYGQTDEALKLFDMAAETARRHNFINDCALALEHKLRLQHRLGLPKTALPAAQEAWGTWGAHGKVKYLQGTFS